MSITAKALINSKYALSTDNAEYTAPTNTQTIIDKFTAVNIDTVSHTLTVHVVPSGQATGNSNLLTKATAVAAGAIYTASEMQSQILNPGDKVVVSASADSVMMIRMSGREVS